MAFQAAPGFQLGEHFKPWFPAALVASVAGGALLWWALTDFERARYYPALLGIPALVFAIVGLAGLPIAQHVSQGFQALQHQNQVIMSLPFV